MVGQILGEAKDKSEISNGDFANVGNVGGGELYCQI